MSNKTVLIIDQCGQDDLKFLVVDGQDIKSLDGVYIGTCAPDGRSDEDHDRMCDQAWDLISDESVRHSGRICLMSFRHRRCVMGHR